MHTHPKYFYSLAPNFVFAPAFVNYKRCTRLAAAYDKVYQLLPHGRWFSPDTPAFSTTNTGRHDIAEILLKVAIKPPKKKSNQLSWFLQNALIPGFLNSWFQTIQATINGNIVFRWIYIFVV